MGQSLTRPVPLRSTTELLTGKSNLDSALQVRIRHVLLPTEDEAQSILGEVSTVNTNPSRALAKWAETHSRCPSGTSGGDLGWVRPGSLVAELEEAVTSIPVGRPSLLKSRFGWHVLLKEDVANVGIALSNVSNEGGDDVHESLKALSGAISSSPWKGPPIVPDGLERSQNKKLPKRQVQEPEAVSAKFVVEVAKSSDGILCGVTHSVDALGYCIRIGKIE